MCGITSGYWSPLHHDEDFHSEQRQVLGSHAARTVIPRCWCISVAAESTDNADTQIAAAKSQPSTTTPLLLAILANEDEEKEIVVGDIIAAKAALYAGANVNERNATFNDTPLLRAAMLGQMQMVRLAEAWGRPECQGRR